MKADKSECHDSDLSRLSKVAIVIKTSTCWTNGISALVYLKKFFRECSKIAGIIRISCRGL